MKINTETTYIKNKFSTLLSKMVTDAKLGYNEITNKFIENDFLDCFEKNDLSEFYDKSYEAIIFDLFKKECSFSEGIDPVVYWCGTQYINIFLNKRIPLKQLFLICSLKQMESYYEIYHQQNESKFIDMFIEKIYSESILKILRKKRNYSARQLAVLSSISINTIKYYENNKNLYNASFENINKLTMVLNYSYSLIKEKTDYIPSYNPLINIKEIRTNFEKYISYFYNSDANIEYYADEFWLLETHKKKIEKKVIDSAIVYAIENYSGDKLLF